MLDIGGVLYLLLLSILKNLTYAIDILLILAQFNPKNKLFTVVVFKAQVFNTEILKDLICSFLSSLWLTRIFFIPDIVRQLDTMDLRFCL